MKYTVKYLLQGEVEIEAESLEQARDFFNDRVGVSEDDIYENAGDEVVYNVILSDEIVK